MGVMKKVDKTVDDSIVVIDGAKMPRQRLTGQQEAFAVAFIKRGQQSLAYRDVYDCSRMKDATVHRNAWALFKLPKVNSRIKELQQQVANVVVEAAAQNQAKPLSQVLYGALEVFLHYQDIVTADPNKIISHRRVNCRHCNGKDHHYQWVDRQEFTQALAEAMDINSMRAAMKPKRRALDLPTDSGGYGWAFNGAPHPGCPKCMGEGKGDVLITDTNLLGPKERKLYKGVRIKKGGEVEVLMHDQKAALDSMAKVLGMMVEKVKLLDGNTPDDRPALPADPIEASRIYTQWIKGGA